MNAMFLPAVKELRHLPSNEIEALRDLNINIEAHNNIFYKHYKDKFFVIVALPKTASTVIRDSMKYLFEEFIGKDGHFENPRYMDSLEHRDIRTEIVKDYLDGGIYKQHISPSFVNLYNIRLLCTKTIILIRHPADYIVAQACDYFRTFSSDKTRKYKSQSSFVANPLIPMIYGDVCPSNKIDGIIDYSIDSGLLWASLDWISTWYKNAHHIDAEIIKYETFMNDRIETISKISKLFYDREPTKKQLEHIQTILNDGVEQRKTDDRFNMFYPNGYTDVVGICNNYLTDDQKNRYIKQVNAYVDGSPNSKFITELYPNLLDFDKIGETK